MILFKLAMKIKHYPENIQQIERRIAHEPLERQLEHKFLIAGYSNMLIILTAPDIS
jgi:hypothetical protein